MDKKQPDKFILIWLFLIQKNTERNYGMKIALVQDWLMCRGGGEQVALSFHKAFPDAPIYTQCYQPHLTFSEFKGADIRTTWLQPIAKSDNLMKKLFFPLGVWAMESLDVTDYDVVLMSGTHCAKYVRVSPNALVISFNFTPFRIAWNPESYAQYIEAGPVKKRLFDTVLQYLRNVDSEHGRRPDYYIGMTDETAERLRTTYEVHNPIEIINPPVNADKFHVSDKPKDYFLVVSRLEYYKKVDLVIDAFNELGYPLVVVGKGLQADEIKARAKSNVTFLSGLSAQELADVYAGCRAFIFPQHEDYGITPLEANAAGRPVIAYGAGGVLATQLPVQQDVSKATALFFAEQTISCLTDAVLKFEEVETQFDPNFIRKHAEKYDEPLFIRRIQQFVQEKYDSFSKQVVA